LKDSPYFPQVLLLADVLPLVAEERCFALKGGTAINMFVREMPRLSVDIDLTYLPIQSRPESLKEIGAALKRIKSRIQKLVGVKVRTVTPKGIESPTSLIVSKSNAQIKIEANFVLRGTVFPVTRRTLSPTASKLLDRDLEIQCLSIADLYGGKICAALDRQHPRDLFDIMLLLNDSGITDEIRKAFLVYLASHSRPMSELLDPTVLDIINAFKNDFVGMSAPLRLEDLLQARANLISYVKSKITPEEKEFLISIKEGVPLWNKLGISGIEHLPGIKWKLHNILQMRPAQHKAAAEKLRKVLYE
jgi:predicted nucleotidyltransferase component of viral defense system